MISTLNKGIIIVPEINIRELVPELYENENITSLFPVEDNQLLIGTYSGNLYQSHLKDKTINSVYPLVNDFKIAVKRIKRYGDYLMVSRGRFCIYDLKNNRSIYPKISNIRDFELVGDSLYLIHTDYIFSTNLKDLLTGKTELNLLKNEGGKSITKDPNSGKLYLNLSDGIYEYQHGKLKLVDYLPKGCFPTSILHDGTFLWIGTLSNGLYGIQNDKVVKHIGTSDGLSENQISTVISKEGTLWIMTNKILYKYHLKSKKISKCGWNYGININQINPLATVL